ncbi:MULTISPECIES: phosphoglucosamine mutase [unclassified Tolypothrix]|uniref:phosphoglucosamine mutase n=1 Tax=unclassified Tolypothrix TaxID=2649714 RepID=UPI0005EAA541|nr:MULTISPECIES: phosphoglucosamine mutase [unclassified Tolypothrix]BAY88762.1 phosphoglucosamine mutase [Microchaete diplosiphon NIES-3275]EKF01651.1 phosphoglucosamine mutase [Tolypothrix sp. PCC 7601]MBE9086454.1 phosphoglucosamine mutase [Tolypothrix sp. LEGE 11397]UYD29422.1 phosphoglucosamine mutase [Tolypothrix sp. PCC 7712]UYD34670.1 phosphoglucosamine mutase [Tolypothrix sp. PCC 7601]
MVSSITRTQGGIQKGLTAAENIESNSERNLIVLPKNPLFGTDGIRGKVGDLLNAPLALQVGFWAGIVLRSHAANPGPVILGQDSRNSSDMLAMALSAGLTAAGVEVWHLGLCPTPCVAYLTSMSDAIGGVMISASHNPPEDNGIKVFGGNGAKLPLALQAEIEAGLRGNMSAVANVSHCGRHYSRKELIGDYSEALKQPLQSEVNLQGMKIVLDLAWGAAVGLAPEVFTEMGAEVICLHNQADGDRINVNCGSTHLEFLQATVQEHNADVGFAFDGDADRVLAVDSKGRQVNGDYILYLWGRHLQQKQQLPENLIVSTVMANLGFEKAWQQIGGKLIRTAVGDQYVQAEMLRHGGMLGGEQSGHILCRHYGITGDGLLTALHIAALIKEAGISLHEMVDQSFQTYPQILRNVRVLDRDRRLAWKDCEPLQKAIAQAEAAMGDAGRILVRVSGTEPVIRVMVEAANAELTNHWTNELVSQVQQHLG